MKNLIFVLIPLLGTTLGSAVVFILKKDINEKVKKILIGFSAGVMIAAAIFSLILPAIEQAKEMNITNSWIPAAIGFTAGMFFY